MVRLSPGSFCPFTRQKACSARAWPVPGPEVVLAVIVVVFLVRGALLSGTPNATTSGSGPVLLLGVLYYGVAVHARRFGLKRLLPLLFF